MEIMEEHKKSVTIILEFLRACGFHFGLELKVGLLYVRLVNKKFHFVMHYHIIWGFGLESVMLAKDFISA
jgi:hypothetical protein